MPWTFEKLLKDIDRKRLPKGAREEFIRRKQSSYDFLLNALKSDLLTEKQIINALYLVYELRMFRDVIIKPDELFDVFLKLSLDSRNQIRNTAFKLSIIQYRVSKYYPSLQLTSESVAKLKLNIDKVLSLGINADSITLMEVVLKEEK